MWLLYHPEAAETAVLKQVENEQNYLQERDVYIDLNSRDPEHKSVFKLLDHDDELKVLIVERGD